MAKPYMCCVCGRSNVKLYRPYMYTEPLICGQCAEKRQSPLEYQEYDWEKQNDGSFLGTPTGKKLPLPKWQINSKGQVPSYQGPGPEGSQPMTDHLIVNLKEIDKSYSSGETTMIPAVPDASGEFWGYTSVPEKDVIWWESLPK